MDLRIHVLKSNPAKLLKYVKAEQKTFEVRINDRDFRVGDLLLMIAWYPDKGYDLGDFVLVSVPYILDGWETALKDNYCVMSIKPANHISADTFIERVRRDPTIKFINTLG